MRVKLALILLIYMSTACWLAIDDRVRQRQVDDRNWHLSRCEIGCSTNFQECLTKRGHAPGACAQTHADCERECR